MNLSARRVRAIFVKDYKEFSRNYALSILLVFPLVFAVIFRAAGASLPGAIGFLLNISFVTLTSFVQACLIAEEKERNTLRSLMMTPATRLDVLIGKSALVGVMSVVVLAISLAIFGYEPASWWAFVVANLLSIILYIAAGTICGLYSKTLLDASLTILPVALIFSGAPWGAYVAEDYPIFRVLDYMPSSQLVHLLNVPHTGYAWTDLFTPLLFIFAWTVVLTVAALALYQRRLKDE
ncbi:hypothetical protein PA598K_04972 [Paenibacillus sp. 598K]|uniref:ABC transporter permease n=1 Tax=Paenibacillus sp. 598K TaxID=1117987 RepID=UPI000FF9E147|nr:ABC transporter permease [Paenibacillus sp. 598K]GBF76498.1 hypothetical protein PA598K_04972 [Paenibacillus sp. 598K]